MKNEMTSARVAKIAAQGFRDPFSLSSVEIRAVCGSVLTQRPDKPKKPVKKTVKKPVK